MKKILVSFILLVGFAFTAFGQYHHEYADLTEKKINYKDWTYKNVYTDKEVNLREFTKDKKLVMVFYFAPWCHASNFQFPITQKLYDKYKDKGLGIIGVSLYASKERVQKKLKSEKIKFPVVVETETNFRKETLHYKYRKKTGDKRKWGTPYNVFLVPSELKTKGDTLAKKTVVVNGEIREAEAEKYIREKLGLPAEEKKTEKAQAKKVAVEECKEDTKLNKVGVNQK